MRRARSFNLWRHAASFIFGILATLVYQQIASLTEYDETEKSSIAHDAVVEDRYSNALNLRVRTPESATSPPRTTWCVQRNATERQRCEALIRDTASSVDKWLEPARADQGHGRTNFDSKHAMEGLTRLRLAQEEALTAQDKENHWCGKAGKSEGADSCRADTSFTTTLPSKKEFVDEWKAMSLDRARAAWEGREPGLYKKVFFDDHRQRINFGARPLTMDGTKVTLEQLGRLYEKVFEGANLESAPTWLGVSLQQDPSDALAIADLLWRMRPDLVIELGTSGGGSAAFYGHVMKEYNPKARLLTIDPASGKTNGVPLKQWNDPKVKTFCPHCRHATETSAWASGQIQFLRALPSDPVVLSTVEALVAESEVVLIVEDSNHLAEVVFDNLYHYARFVSPGSYFIVQDTRLVWPLQAIAKFLKSPLGRCFEIDKRLEYFVVTQHWDGFLRRVDDPNCGLELD